MKLLVLFLFSATISFSQTNISFDRNNNKLEEVLSSSILTINDISLKAQKNESKALYELGNIDDVDLSVASLSTVNSIYKNNPNKVSKYSILTPLEKRYMYIVVSKNSNIQTIYDLNKKSINVGIEKNSEDLFSITLESNFNILFSKHYLDSKTAILSMIQGSGLDAVILSLKSEDNILKQFSQYIKIIPVPFLSSISSETVGKNYLFQENNIKLVNSDLVLIAKNSYIKKNPASINLIIENILKNKNIDKKYICSFSSTSIKEYSYLKQVCTKEVFDDTLIFDKSIKKIFPPLVLNKPIDSIEDIEVYPFALLKNKSFGGLNTKTEKNKIEKIVNYFKEEESSKLIIKSYSNTNSPYKGGKRIFKLLQKKGINRGSMIIKSFKTKKMCGENDRPECKYIHTKVAFELL